MNQLADNSIIALDKFIQSTRDSGYKNTASAVSEIVDNAIQANAKNISITIKANEDAIDIAIVDDGCGMDEVTLQQALRFGGSSRFNSRNGLGRFGMGLPNASLSQAKKVSVYTWQNKSAAIYTYLDVDEIASTSLKSIPTPIKQSIPAWLTQKKTKSGTAVIWTNCDRLDHKRISTIEKKLHQAFGRIFRYYIWEGVNISINEQTVSAIDPLFLSKDTEINGASRFQDTWKIEIYTNPDNPSSSTGIVEVTFSELPIHKWHKLSNEEKRRIGIANSAGVSIIREKREVDFGWYFMGSKRRENYDDWWRCEIKFDASLDEAFGITHTKQQIKPKEYLLEAIQSYTETMAKALNSRVRQAHTDAKISRETFSAERVAQDRDKRMRPLELLESNSENTDSKALKQLAMRHPALKEVLEDTENLAPNYRLVEDEFTDVNFFKPLITKGTLIGVLNSKHKFYKQIYKPALDNQSSNNSFTSAIQLMLLAAARAEAILTEEGEKDVIERFRQEWSHAMNVLLA